MIKQFQGDDAFSAKSDLSFVRKSKVLQENVLSDEFTVNEKRWSVLIEVKGPPQLRRCRNGGRHRKSGAAAALSTVFVCSE